MPATLKCMCSYSYINFNNIQNSVARRFGPENQDYRKKSEFARLSFDIDAGTRYTYTHFYYC